MEIKWGIRDVYLYAVCLITLVMVVMGMVNALQTGFEFAFQPPDIYKTIPWEEKISAIEKDPQKAREMIQLEQARFEREQKYNLYRRLFESMALIVVALPVYLYHWRQIQKKE